MKTEIINEKGDKEYFFFISWLDRFNEPAPKDSVFTNSFLKVKSP